MKVEVTGQYDRMYAKVITRDPQLARIVADRILLFQKNIKDTRLKTHRLKKRMSGKYAFSVTDDIRIIFVWQGKSTALFLAIGKHKEVYSY